MFLKRREEIARFNALLVQIHCKTHKKGKTNRRRVIALLF